MSNFDVYAPLSGFYWQGDSFQLTPGLRIIRFAQNRDLQNLNLTLAEDEQQELAAADHWLEFKWSSGTEPNPAETVNLILLSLWLVKSTRTHVAFRFELGQDHKRRSRLYDRFAWVEGAHDVFDDNGLIIAASYYSVLQKICCDRGRLNHALVLTVTGCCSHHWQVALICHAAAAEAILTYEQGNGITRRLATTYACLVEAETAQRNRGFQEFSELYSVRSDIMHGRTQNISQEDRIPILIRFNAILRRLWDAVLLSPGLIEVLKGPDKQRKEYFRALQNGYNPPNIPH